MARVTGPLMSMDASGTVASTIVFSKWKGLPYVRRHAVPSNPRLPKQMAVRATLAFLSRAFTPIGPPVTTRWNVVAETMHQSGFNRFVAVNQINFAHLLPPYQDPTVLTPGTPAAAPTVSVAGGIGVAVVSITAGNPTAGWGWLIFGALGATPLIVPQSIVGVINENIPDFVHSPIAAGTWHYVVRGFNAEPTWGADSTDETAVVT